MQPSPKTRMEATEGAIGLSGLLRTLYRFRFWLAGLGLAGIFALSSVPFHSPPPFRGWDKHLHVVEFFLVGLVVVNGFTGGLRRITLPALGGAWALMLLVALLNEVYQGWIPGRSGDAKDMLASALGATVAVLLAGIYMLVLKRIRARPASVAPLSGN